MTDNVTPITPRSNCASCGADVAHEDRFDPLKHGANCRQPEIRMRRVEGQLEELLAGFRELAAAHNEAITELLRLKDLINARIPAQSTEPPTQRSVVIGGDWGLSEAIDRRFAHADPGAAEPAGSEAPGAVHPGGEPERPEGPAGSAP